MSRCILIFFAVLLLTLGRIAWADEASADLQRAIAEAPAGATVTVPAGVHRVHLVINRAITLIGEPGAVLDGGDEGDVIRVETSHVTVTRLAIRHSGTSLTDEDSGIYVARNVSDISITHNRLEGVLFGIYLDGPSRVDVTDNVVIGMPELAVPNRGDGIHLWNDAHCVIARNDVSHTRDGIYVYISPDNTIEDNVIHDVRYGVHYMYSKHNVLRGNVSRDNTAGFALMSSDHLEVIGNRAYDDQSYGILLNYVNYSNIRDNEIASIEGQLGADGEPIPGAEGKGIFVYLCQGNRIVGNLIERSRIGIHVTAGSDQNRFHGNAFVANRTQVMYVQNIRQEWSADGRGNYWSNYMGWDLNGDGIGDVPYRPNDGVDVLMWKYPSASLLASSPAILLLRYVQRAFPVFTPPGVTDSRPLMRLPAISRSQPHGQRH